MFPFGVDIKDVENEVLLDMFKATVEQLPGGGAGARSHYYEIQKELLERLNDEK